MNFLQRHKMQIFCILVSLVGFTTPFFYYSVAEMGWGEVYATIFFLIFAFLIQYNFPLYLKWKEEGFGRDNKKEVKREVNGRGLIVLTSLLFMAVAWSMSMYHGFSIIFVQLLPIWWLKKIKKPDDEKTIIIRSFLLLLFLWIMIPLALLSLYLFNQKGSH